MSGRKQWEVASVLDEVSKSREKIYKEYKNDLLNIKSEVDLLKSEIDTNELEKNISLLKDENLKKDYEDYKNSLDELDILLKEFDSVLDEIEIDNKRAKQLREQIRGKSHYMDKEYAQAEQIRNSLILKGKKLLNIKQRAYKYKSKVFRLKSFSSNINDLLQARRDYLTKELDNLVKMFSKKEVVLLEDYVNDNNNLVSKIEYLDHYKKSNNLNELNKQVKNIKNLINNNLFDEANLELENLKNRILSLQEEADKLREDIESSFDLTLKIRDLMIDKLYFSEAEIQLIDDNPANGFKLIVKNGDTIIFENISVNEGKVNVNLDHIEGTHGSCGVRWGELKEVFNNYGIPLTDVLKDNRSVIYSNRVVNLKDKYERSRK